MKNQYIFSVVTRMGIKFSIDFFLSPFANIAGGPDQPGPLKGGEEMVAHAQNSVFLEHEGPLCISHVNVSHIWFTANGEYVHYQQGLGPRWS